MNQAANTPSHSIEYQLFIMSSTLFDKLWKQLIEDLKCGREFLLEHVSVARSKQQEVDAEVVSPRSPTGSGKANLLGSIARTHPRMPTFGNTDGECSKPPLLMKANHFCFDSEHFSLDSEDFG